jgi:hypothetical protein
MFSVSVPWDSKGCGSSLDAWHFSAPALPRHIQGCSLARFSHLRVGFYTLTDSMGAWRPGMATHGTAPSTPRTLDSVADASEGLSDNVAYKDAFAWGDHTQSSQWALWSQFLPEGEKIGPNCQGKILCAIIGVLRGSGRPLYPATSRALWLYDARDAPRRPSHKIRADLNANVLPA